MAQIETIDAEQLPVYAGEHDVMWHIEDDGTYNGFTLVVEMNNRLGRFAWSAHYIDFDDDAQDWVTVEEGIEVTAAMKAYLLKGIGR